MTKSTRKKGNSAEIASPINWLLIGSIVGVGALLFIGALLWGTLGGEPPLTLGEIEQTRAAEAISAEEQADAAFASLSDYCETNAERCIVEGDAQSENVVFEFSDYSCPHCKTFIDQQYPSIKTQLIETGSIKYVTIPAPILGQTPNTPLSVNATLCAAQQGHGSDYHVGVYSLPSSGREAAETDLLSLGESLGLVMDRFSACVEGEENEQAALANRSIVSQAGIGSTPTLLLNGRPVEASAQALSAALQSTP